MAAVQVISGRGGWPMSCFLAPDGKPFYGATFFPRASFKELLGKVAAVWKDKREDVLKDCERLTQAVRDHLASRQVPSQNPLNSEFIEGSIDDLYENFDTQRGGFSLAPKFPPNNGLPYMLYLRQRDGTKGVKKLDHMLMLTLDQMALGGIHDHVGGGFHRYSTDERWFLPHFEKMLYDNALLSVAYAQASVVYKNPDYERVARDVCDWVLREMTAPGGGFYSSLDADSEGVEGKFYVWNKSELEHILGPDTELFCRVFNTGDDGNFREEHSGTRTGMSILYLSRPLFQLAPELKLTEAALREKVDAWKKTLLAVRIKRVWPGLDDKELSAWNGLMISALARTAVLLNEPRYKDAAVKAAEFMLANQRTKEGRWLATHRQGLSKLPAYLDDHAFLALAFLDVYAATKDERWKNEAIGIVDVLDKHFSDPAGGGYFFVADDHEKLLARTKDPVDKAIPSGNGWAAQVLVRLWSLTGEERYRQKARALLGEFQGIMERAPHATESLLLAAAQYVDLERQKGLAAAVPIKNEPRAEAGPVTVELSAATTSFKRGASVPVAVKFTIQKGSHIQAHKPDDRFVKATHFTLLSKDLGDFGAADFPAPESIELPELGKLKIYSGEATGRAELKISPTAPLGKTALRVKAYFQACNDKECDQPQEVILSLPVEVGE